MAGDALRATATAAVADVYRDRCHRFGKNERRLSRQSDGLSHGRAALFLLAVGFAIAVVTDPDNRVAWLAVLGGVAAVFAGLVAWHRVLLRRLAHCRDLREVNEQSLARLDRAWDGIPLSTVDVPREHSALDRDLDLFGRASLFHLISTANTPLGIGRLCDWLVQPAAPELVFERQRAVQELEPLLDFRQELAVRGRPFVRAAANPASFVGWAEGRPWLAARHWLRVLAIVLPLLLLVLVAINSEFWSLVLTVNIALSLWFSPQMHGIFGTISARHGGLQQYVALFELIRELPASSPLVIRLQRETLEGGGGARQLRRLNRIMDLANLRFSTMIYVAVQAFTLWDIHLLARLESWQTHSGRYVRRWFEALGELEALVSLATLGHDHPDWVFPVLKGDSPRQLTAEALGHPLLADQVRVANDVSIGPPGTLLLVTGSNMSGKSTLLRSVGVNVVLAQAGVRVCAARMELPPLELATCMRVEDSLQDGTSYFMAELKQLKHVVELARRHADDTERTLLYLLDEILQGTNTAERQIAACRVLGHLLSRGAIGAVSTHDLELARSEALAAACRCVHFRETLHDAPGEPPMTFDYRMRPGVATTTNALKLLEIVGLGPESDF